MTDPAAGLAKGELKILLHGRKLTGSWALVQMKGRGEANWLLIKHRDDAARPGFDIEAEAPDSVATGRSLEQIARGGRRHEDSGLREQPDSWGARSRAIFWAPDTRCGP